MLKKLFILFIIGVTFGVILFVYFYLNSICSNDEAYYPANKSCILKDVAYGTDSLNTMDLYLPVKRDSLTPVLILIHGGAWVMGDKENFFHDFATYFRRNKVIVANLNYSLVSDHNSYKDLIMDVSRAVSYLKLNSKRFEISSNKFNLLGSSAGAHLALLYSYVSYQNKDVKSVISLAGPTNLADSSFRRKVETEWGMPNLYSRLVGEKEPISLTDIKNCSPFYKVQNIPTLLIHAIDDDVVPFSQSAQLELVLQSKKVKHRLFVLPNGQHGPFGTNDIYKRDIEDLILNWIKSNSN